MFRSSTAILQLSFSQGKRVAYITRIRSSPMVPVTHTCTARIMRSTIPLPAWTTITPGVSDAYATVQNPDGSVHYYWNNNVTSGFSWVGIDNNTIYNAVDFGLAAGGSASDKHRRALLAVYGDGYRNRSRPERGHGSDPAIQLHGHRGLDAHAPGSVDYPGPGHRRSKRHKQGLSLFDYGRRFSRSI